MSETVPSPDAELRDSVAVSAFGRLAGAAAAVTGPSPPTPPAPPRGASRTGVLQQLHALEQAGLVAHSIERHGVGRPRHLYDVTPNAQDLFPAAYNGFASALLDAIASVGGQDLVEEVFAARRQQLGARLREQPAPRVAPGAPP